jgi:hypothetical protein
MIPYFLYAAVLLAYLPGVVALCIWRKCWHFPLMCFAFLGMLFFNAVGSISVFSEHKLYLLDFDTADVAVELAFVLVFQVFMFYLVAGAYLALRPKVRMTPVADGNDRSLLLIGMVIIVLLGAMYYAQTGTFLILSSLNGSMNMENALQFREQYVYGLKWWSLYNVGFFFLPLFLSSYALILFQVDRSQVWFVCMTLLVSLGSYITLGSKSGFLIFVLSFSVTYFTYFGMVGGAVTKFLRFRKYWIFVGMSLVLLYLGYNRALQGGVSPFSFTQQIWYRVFVTYPETLAGALSYFRDFGALGVSVLPTMRGLLSHEQISLSVELHRYIAGAPGGVSVPFAGEIFLIGGWPALLAVVPMVFAVCIILQEISFLAPGRVAAIAFSALYAYLAMNISMNGMFASVLTFMYPGVVLLLLAIHFGLYGLRSAWRRLRA